MVNKKLSQASSRPTPVPPRKVEKEPTRRSAPATPTTPAKPTPRPTTAAEVPSRIAGAQRIFRETVTELQKVQWPDRVTTRNLTLIVIAMSAALAAILGTLDAILTRLIEWLIRF